VSFARGVRLALERSGVDVVGMVTAGGLGMAVEISLLLSFLLVGAVELELHVTGFLLASFRILKLGLLTERTPGPSLASGVIWKWHRL
jgi:hypothetical protein